MSLRASYVDVGSDLDLKSRDRSRHREIVALLAHSARTAGRAAVGSRRWLGETVLDMAPWIAIGDAETLSRHHANTPL